MQFNKTTGQTKENDHPKNMAQKAALFEQKIADVNKGPEYERVDHGPNFKPGWKHSGNSGGGKIILILI